METSAPKREQAAVADGLTAVSRLYGQLADTVAPDGRTPYQVQIAAHIIDVNDIAIYPVEDKTT